MKKAGSGINRCPACFSVELIRRIFYSYFVTTYKKREREVLSPVRDNCILLTELPQFGDGGNADGYPAHDEIAAPIY